MNAEPKDTEDQGAAHEAVPGEHRLKDPQAVEVEPSGISAKEARRHRRWRNIVLAVALLAFVVLVFVITLVKLHSNVNPPS